MVAPSIVPRISDISPRRFAVSTTRSADRHGGYRGMTDANAECPPAFRNGPRTLAIDVGGTGLKASVLDQAGKMLVGRTRVATPYPCPPKVLVRALAALVAPLPVFDRISVGFPGVVREGSTLTAPHFGNRLWCDFPLAAALSKRLDKPVRLLNDAEVQGFGMVTGRGLEVVLTLGTGAGTAVFRNGVLAPHLELAQHPIRDDQTYNDYIGSEALRRIGVKKWSRRVRKTIKILHCLLHYDVLYLGGGNGDKVINPPDGIRIDSNHAGITGGIRLWDADVEQLLFAGGVPSALSSHTNARHWK